MKWNTEQLELGLSQRRNPSRRFGQRSQRRLQRASWWFDQMRRAVDGADEWRASDRESMPQLLETEDTLAPDEQDRGLNDGMEFYL